MSERSVYWRITTSFAKARKDAERLADSMERLDDQREDLDSRSVEGDRKATKSTKDRNAALSALAKTSKAVSAAEKERAAAVDRETAAEKNSTAATQRGTAATQAATRATQQHTAASQQLAATHQRVQQAQLSRERATLALTAAEQRLSAVEKKHGQDSEQYARALLSVQRRQLDVAASAQRYESALRRVSEAASRASVSSRRVSSDNDLVARSLLNVSRSAMGAVSALAGVGGGLSKMAILVPGVASGIGFLVTAISNLTAGLTSMIGPLLSSANALAALPQMLSVGAGAIGTFIGAFSGIGEALKAGTEAAGASGAAAKKNAGAQRSSARAIEQAQRGIKNAHRAVKDAQLAEKDATKQLMEARKQARREIEDMNDALRDLALRERGASLSVEEARRNLQKAMIDPAADNLARAQAQLAYDEAVAQMDSVKKEQARAQKDTEEANKKGVEGSDQVVSALKAQKDALRAVKDAQQGVKDAQQALKDAQIGAAGATAAAAGATDKYAQALSKLSPAGQQFVKTLLGMRDELQRLKFAAQEGLLPGLGEALTTMLKLVPLAEKGLFQFGQTMASTAKKGANLLTSKDFMPMWQRLLESNNKLLGMAGDALLNLVEAVVYLMDASRPFTEWLSTTILGWTEYWKNISKAGNETGKTAAKLEQTKETLSVFGNILKNLWNTFKNIGRAGWELGNDLWGSFERITQGWADWTGSIEGQNKLKEWFDAARAPLHEFGVILGGITKWFFDMGISGSENLTKILQKVQELGPPLKSMFDVVTGDYGVAFINTLVEVGKAIAGLISVVGPALQPVVEGIGKLATGIYNLTQNPTAATIIGNIAQGLAVLAGLKFTGVLSLATRFLPALIAATGPIGLIAGGIIAFAGALSFLAKGTKAGESTNKKFASFWEALKKTFADFMKSVKPLVNFLMKNVVPMFVDGFGDLIDAVKVLLPWWKTLGKILALNITGSLTAIGFAFKVLAKVIKWVAENVIQPVLNVIVKAFDWLYDVLVGHSIIPDLIKAIQYWFGLLKTTIFPIVKKAIDLIVKVFKTVFPVILKAVQVWWAGVKLVFSAIKGFIEKVVAPVLTWLYQNVFKPAFEGILALVKVWWAGVKVVFSALKSFFEAVVWPVLQWLWDRFKWVFEKIVDGAKVYIEIFKKIWGKIKDWVIDPLVKAWPKVKEAWENIKGAFSKAFDAVKKVFGTVWSKVKDWLIDPIKSAWEKIGPIIDKIKDAFKGMKDRVGDIMSKLSTTISSAWGGIVEAIKAPIRLAVKAINTAINAYNNTVGKIPKFGKEIGTISLPDGFARGGIPSAKNMSVYPGYTPGRDVGYIGISGGEAIMRPEWTRAVGSSGVEEMNRIARTEGVSGLRKRFRGNFASGGIPAVGSWNRHTSGYEWARWAGDINVPGAGDYGNPVRAYKDGQVASVIDLGDRSYGRYIRINHPGGERTLYAHLSAATVVGGQAVRRGQMIGRVGDRGNAYGPHLHFEISGGSDPIISGSSGGTATAREPKPSDKSVMKSIFGKGVTSIFDFFSGKMQANLAASTADAGFFGESGPAMGHTAKETLTSSATATKAEYLSSLLKSWFGGNKVPKDVDGAGAGESGDSTTNAAEAGNFRRGGVVRMFRKGGRVPGVGNKDTVPAMLTPGEFVMNKRAVAQVGVANLAALNGGMGDGSQSGGVSYYHAGGYVGDFRPGVSFPFVKALEYLVGLGADGYWDSTLTSYLQNANLALPAYANYWQSSAQDQDLRNWIVNSPVNVVTTGKGKKKVSSFVGGRSWAEVAGRYGLTNEQTAHWWTRVADYVRGGLASFYTSRIDSVYPSVAQPMVDAFTSLNNTIGIPPGGAWPGYPSDNGIGNTTDALKHLLDHVFGRNHDQFAFRPWQSWTPTEAALIAQIADNDRREKWLGAMGTLSGWGLTNLVKDLAGKGYTDEAGYNIALDAATNRNMATQLDEQIRIANLFSMDDLTKLLEMIAFLNSGTAAYGLRDVARHLGMSDFSTVRLWQNAKEAGRLANVPPAKSSRLEQDITSYFAGTFYANTGGLVPGVGSTDTVPAMLTPGEFVIRKKAAQALGLNNLLALNNMQHFNSGGLVMAPSLSGIPTNASVGVSARSLSGAGVVYNINNNYDVDINNPIAEPSTKSMLKALQRQSVLGTGGSSMATGGE